MGTAAVVGIAEPGGGWRGVYVGYDGIPERLGRALLDLSFDLGNDLNAVWSFVARAPEGWRFAFSEAYEPGDNREYFQTGRSEPFLRNDDPFVRDNVAFSFILDPEARTLAIHDNTSGPARLDERVRFLDDHRLAFDHGPADPLDWRNRHTDRGTDDPAETAQYLLAMLDEALPIVSTTIALCTLAREKHPAALTAEGFIVPVVLYVTEPDATSDNGVRVTDIVEHDHYRLLPRRALSHRLRCELALAAALEAIATQAKRRVASASLETLSELFPFDLLDLALDESTLQAAIRTRISDCFEPG